MAARGMENSKYQGSKWISRPRRLAIYLRDGMSCVYCGATIEDGASLTLDHLTPFCEGGTHESHNLVTCCSRCNSSRGARSVKTFVAAVAEYLDHDVKASSILRHITCTVKRPVDVKAAGKIIRQRGSWQAALKG